MFSMLMDYQRFIATKARKKRKTGNNRKKELIVTDRNLQLFIFSRILPGIKNPVDINTGFI